MPDRETFLFVGGSAQAWLMAAFFCFVYNAPLSLSLSFAMMGAVQSLTIAAIYILQRKRPGKTDAG